MTEGQEELLRALDGAIAECKRAKRHRDAAAVASRLEALSARLALLREEAVAGRVPDSADFGALVRETGTWAVDRHLHILAALGGVVRALPRTRSTS